MRVLVAAASCVLAVACAKQRDTSGDVPLDKIVVVDSANLQTKAVGGAPSPAEINVAYKLGEQERLFGEGEPVDASYALVDVENKGDQDANVSLGGELQGESQTAPLRVESLHIPAGQRRTFVLLDKDIAPRPWAQGIKVVVTGAVVAKFPPPVTITEQHLFPDGDRVVVAANVTSTVKKRGRVMILAAFHDAKDKPVSRAHSLISIEAGATQSVRFVGPPGSKTATVFPGQSQF